SGHILSKDEMMKQVWPETVVEEANLTRNVSTLRKALGENPGVPQYIETIPWRGYRFVASVREVFEASTDLMVGEHRGPLSEPEAMSAENGRAEVELPAPAKALTAKRPMRISSVVAMIALVIVIA